MLPALQEEIQVKIEQLKKVSWCRGRSNEAETDKVFGSKCGGRSSRGLATPLGFGIVRSQSSLDGRNHLGPCIWKHQKHGTEDLLHQNCCHFAVAFCSSIVSLSFSWPSGKARRWKCNQCLAGSPTWQPQALRSWMRRRWGTEMSEMTRF